MSEMDIAKADWYNALLADIKKLEYGGIVLIKHAIGKRILQDFDKFGKPEYNSKKVENIAKDLNISRRELSRCIQFAREHPEIKNGHAMTKLSWFKIANEILPEKNNNVLKARKDNYLASNKEYVKDSEIINADSLVYMKGLPEDYHLLLTDPPYKTDVDDIDSFAQEWLPLAISKLKNTARAYVFIGAYPDEMKAYLNVQLPNDFYISKILVWEYKNTLGPDTKKDYKQNWQAILHIRTGDSLDINTDILTEKFSVQSFNAPDGRLGNRLHTWQKPDDLIEMLIKHGSKEGDKVLDPFCGTGTVSLMSDKLGRNCTAIDNDNQMIKICKQRGLAIA